MAENSKIEWTKHTANLWHGCTKVHEGCDMCYAEVMAKRWGNDIWGNDKPRKIIKSVWGDLVRYQKLAEKAGEIHRVFVGSMMDIFEKPMPMIDSKGGIVSHPIMGKKDPTSKLGYSTGDLRSFLFAKISNGNCPNLMFLLLTKRPSNINKYIPESWKETPPENVMFGTSPVNKKTCDKLIPQLLSVKGKRFLSIEPQLSSIDEIDLSGIDWVIQGGESGPRKRPFNIDWAYKMREMCMQQGVPYFFKQIDKIQTIPPDLMVRQFPPLHQLTTVAP